MEYISCVKKTNSINITFRIPLVTMTTSIFAHGSLNTNNTRCIILSLISSSNSEAEALELLEHNY